MDKALKQWPTLWCCLQSGMSFLRRTPPAPAHGRSLSRHRAVPLGAALCVVGALAFGSPRSGQAQAVQTEPAPPALPKVERIVHQDAGSVVQELKVGGETTRIEVQPQTDLPGYQVNPTNAAQGPANPDGQRTGNAGSAGRATWRLFNF